MTPTKRAERGIRHEQNSASGECAGFAALSSNRSVSMKHLSKWVSTVHNLREAEQLVGYRSHPQSALSER